MSCVKLFVTRNRVLNGAQSWCLGAVAILLGGCAAISHQVATPESANHPASPTSTETIAFTLNLQHAPDLAATYLTQACMAPCQEPQVNHWYFLRTADAVENRQASGDLAELWRRDESTGTLSYVHLLPNEKKAIEYNPVDLELVHFQRSWEQLATMVSPEEMARMNFQGNLDYAGYPAQKFVEDIDGWHAEVIWIPALQVAAQIRQTDGKHQVETHLESLQPDTLPAHPLSDQDLQTYQQVEYTDIGDMEHSRVNGWIQKALHAPGHDGHEHH